MANRGLLLCKAPSPKLLFFSPKFSFHSNIVNGVRSFSTTNTVSSLQPPDVRRLAETARITLTPREVEEFAPKIRQVVDWFGQLQAVDLSSVEPALRADTEVNSFRDDIPESFENRDAMINAVPSYEEPYIKVPKVLNKE